MKALLQKYFGFSDFRSGQEEAVQKILRGQNTLVIMPTGAGKSLIYQYTALALREQVKDTVAVALVISPLIALMKDQVDSLQAHGIAATYINSTLSAAEQQQRSRSMLRGQYSFVYIAPERLRQSRFIEALNNVVIQLLVIDEAHCISSWGHDFRPDYQRIAEFRQTVGEPLTVALTATATSLVQDDIVRLLGMPEAQRVITGFNRPNLSFEVLYASGGHAKLQELAFLLQEQTTSSGTLLGACIIYTATRKDSEEVASFIGPCCAYYHAGMGTQQREHIQNAFSNGTLPIVVATNAFGMGIDRSDVRLVVHYNLPGTLEAYYQEAGRAGRDGQPSRAVLLYSPQDRLLQDFFIRQNSITLEQLYQLFQRLQELPEAGEGRLCRPQELSHAMAWNQQKLRLALSYLEKSGILQKLEFGEGLLRLRLLGDWDETRASASMGQISKYIRHRKSQLEQMSDYAQAESCRREILLSYFSDHSETAKLSAARCCDYCVRQKLHEQKKSASRPNSLGDLSRSQRAALIILDSVRQLCRAGVSVGRQRISQMLCGSRSQKMTKTFRTQRYYARLQVIAQKQIEMAIDELLQKGYLQHRSLENASVIDLTQQGGEALELREAIALAALGDGVKSLPRVGNSRGSSSEETLRLLEQGMTVGQVAKARGLSDRTIGSHVGSLLEQGKLELNDYVPPTVRQIVEKCLQQLEENGSNLDRLRPIKDMLPPDISYVQLKFVLGAWKRKEL